MGAQLSALAEIWPAEPTYSINNIPDLTGKVMVVTGANTGIGKETAKALLAHNAKVYIAARNKEKAEDAIRDLEQQTGRKAIFLKLDLGDLRAIKASAEEFLRRVEILEWFWRQEKELHVLFNNAGVMFPPMDELTAQGYDLQFGTNVLGHFYFTKLLLPALIAAGKSSPDGKARVINVSSSGHNIYPSLDFNTFKDSPKRRKYFTSQLYGQSKFGNIIFADELHRRYADQGIMSCSLNPGYIRTDLQRHVPSIITTLAWYGLYPTPYGALTQLWVGTSPEGAQLGGKYLGAWARERIPNPNTKNPDLGKQLWQWAEEQVESI